ncbi:MAG: hypothetical protein AAB368_06645, partial [bacterium]
MSARPEDRSAHPGIVTETMPAAWSPRVAPTSAPLAATLSRFGRAMMPYARQVAGQLAIGSAAGILSNALAALPAVMLGRALDRVLDWQAGRAGQRDAALAAAAYAGGVLLVEGPRIARRWWLATANARIRSNLRAAALRGV